MSPISGIPSSQPAGQTSRSVHLRKRVVLHCPYISPEHAAAVLCTNLHSPTKPIDVQRREYITPGTNQWNRWTAPRIRDADKVNFKSEMDRFGLCERVGGCHLHERRDTFAELVRRLLEHELHHGEGAYRRPMPVGLGPPYEPRGIFFLRVLVFLVIYDPFSW